MPHDLEGLADLVVLTVKNAMAPAMEEIALLKRDNADLRAQLAVVGDLRDRVVVVETKAAMPVEAPRMDFTPQFERLATDDARLEQRLVLLERDSADIRTKLDVVADLRDRVVTVETKASIQMPMPPAAEPLPPVDLTSVHERLALVTRECEDLRGELYVMKELRDRVVTIEAKSAHAIAPQPLGVSLSDVDARIVEKMTPVQALVADARERLAAVEVRQPIPGPAGKDGMNGKDGADGLGFDDMEEVIEDEGRTIVRRYKNATGNVREFRHKAVGMLYRGVYVEGMSYTQGDVTTWAGSSWYAKRDTIEKPGDGSKDWQLIVKRGRDGKDGRDALDPVPVVRASGR